MRIPTQREMEFAEQQRRRAAREAEDARMEQLDAHMRRVVENAGQAEVADRLGLEDESLIGHWLSRRGGRRPPVELLDICLDLDPTDGLIAALCAGRYDVPARQTRLTPEQEIAALRRALQEFGAVGEAKLKSITRGQP